MPCVYRARRLSRTATAELLRCYGIALAGQVPADGQDAADGPAETGGTEVTVKLADDLPEVSELELSPLIVQPDGGLTVTARIKVTPHGRRDLFLRL
ncbi:MAG: hypothetical protein ACRDOI_08745 [Trebonia sp.]